MDWGTLFFSFSGRINRARFWVGSLLLVIVSIAALALALVSMSGVIWILYALVAVGVTICGLAIAVKRLHDGDKSAWWLVPYYLGPAVAGAIGDAAGNAGLIFYLISIGISTWAVIDMGFLRGTAGPNRFGPDPLDLGLAGPAPSYT